MKSNTIVISLSGGVDSATVLALALDRELEVRTFSFSYGSKHEEYELKAATALAEYYGVPHQIIPTKETMSSLQSNLLKTGGEIPEGHYTDETMKSTVVPCRNLIFLSILAGIADSIGFRHLALGIHQGDHAIYPDCRPEFFKSVRTTIEYATEHRVILWAPFLKMTKGDIVRKGLVLGVPYKLTRTCYKDQPVPCGKCGACVERREAFMENGVTTCP